LEADIKKRKRKSSKRGMKEKNVKGLREIPKHSIKVRDFERECFAFSSSKPSSMVAIRSIKNRRYNADMSNKKETVQNKKVY